LKFKFAVACSQSKLKQNHVEVKNEVKISLECFGPASSAKIEGICGGLMGLRRVTNL
jgi:hypothetical protein